MCCLTRGEEDDDLLCRLLESLGERRDRLGQQHCLTLGCERQTDICGGQNLLGELAESLPELGAEGHAAHLGQHAHHRTSELRCLGRQVLLPGTRKLLGDGIAEALPRRHGLFQPLHRSPRDGLADTAGQCGRVVEPDVGETNRVGDGVRFPLQDRGEVADLLAGEVRREVVVDRPRCLALTTESEASRTHPAEHAAELAEYLAERRGVERLTAEREAEGVLCGIAATRGAAGRTTALVVAVLVAVVVVTVAGRGETEGQITHGFHGTVRVDHG